MFNPFSEYEPCLCVGCGSEDVRHEVLRPDLLVDEPMVCTECLIFDYVACTACDTYYLIGKECCPPWPDDISEVNLDFKGKYLYHESEAA